MKNCGCLHSTLPSEICTISFWDKLLAAVPCHIIGCDVKGCTDDAPDATHHIVSQYQSGKEWDSSTVGA